MKATIVNSLTYFLFVASTSAQKDRIYQAEGGIRQNPGYSELPAELDRGDEDNNVFLLGRSANSNCGGGGHGTLDSLHHYSPCDEDVESNGVDNSNSISTRYDPVVTEAPEAPEGSEGTEGSEDPSDAQETPTDVCISSDGIFGNILDTTALMTLPITYLYEMQTVTGTDQDQINDKILPKLEKFIMDSILPEVFPTKCAATAIGKRRQRRNLQNDGLLEVIGVSMYPPDDITSNSCEVLTASDSTNECFVLNGQMSIFLDEDQVVNQDQMIQMQERINNLIEEKMNSGVYDDASEEITKLHYLEKRDPTESNVGDTNGGDGLVENRNNRSLRMGLFVGLGMLAAVLAGVVFRLTRRIRNNDDQTDMHNSQVQTYLDLEGQRRSASFN